MNYDEKQICKTYEIIDGKKVPVYKIPTGMSGPNNNKIDDYPDDDDNDETLVNPSTDSSYDEENNYFYVDKFIDIE